MKKVLWITLVAMIAALVVVGTVAAKKYKSRSHQTHDQGAFLGVVTESVDRDLAERYDLAVDFGALVERVVYDSPAENAGLREDDVIVELDGRKVRDSEDLSDMLSDYEGGDEVQVVVRRDGDTIEYSVTLSDRQDLLEGIVLPSDFGSIVAPNVVQIPRAPKVPSVPQALWFDSQQPYMGISMMDITRQLGEFFGVQNARGVLVTEVEKGSPAEEAGLKAGDVIVQLDGDRIGDYEDVRDIISESDAGEKLKVVVVREKKELELEVTVDERANKDRFRDRWGMRSLGDLDVYYSDDDEAWTNSFDAASGMYNLYLESEEFDEDMDELREELKELQLELNHELRELKNIQ